MIRRSFNEKQVHQFWALSKDTEEFTRLSTLAKLLLEIPEFSIPQEQQFSDLNRRCSGTLNLKKIEVVDRDVVGFPWLVSA